MWHRELREKFTPNGGAAGRVCVSIFCSKINGNEEKCFIHIFSWLLNTMATRNLHFFLPSIFLSKRLQRYETNRQIFAGSFAAHTQHRHHHHYKVLLFEKGAFWHIFICSFGSLSKSRDVWRWLSGEGGEARSCGKMSLWNCIREIAAWVAFWGIIFLYILEATVKDSFL